MALMLAQHLDMMYLPCPRCGGVGETGTQFQLSDGSIDDDIATCPMCKGSGKMTKSALRFYDEMVDVLQRRLCEIDGLSWSTGTEIMNIVVDATIATSACMGQPCASRSITKNTRSPKGGADDSPALS